MGSSSPEPFDVVDVTRSLARYEVGRMAESVFQDWLNEDGEYTNEAFDLVREFIGDVIDDLKYGYDE